MLCVTLGGQIAVMVFAMDVTSGWLALLKEWVRHIVRKHASLNQFNKANMNAARTNGHLKTYDPRNSPQPHRPKDQETASEASSAIGDMFSFNLMCLELTISSGYWDQWR